MGVLNSKETILKSTNVSFIVYFSLGKHNFWFNNF